MIREFVNGAAMNFGNGNILMIRKTFDQDKNVMFCSGLTAKK